MNIRRMIVTVFLAAISIVFIDASAYATVAYVSKDGVDTNTCAYPSLNQAGSGPCQYLTTAVSRSPDGGTVMCVDATTDGPLTITKSVTIDCVSGGGAQNLYSITINAPGKTVRLRNLAINASGPPPSYGIEIIAAAVVDLDNVFIAGPNMVGVYDHRSGGQSKLFVRNSNISSVGVGIVAASAVVGITVLDNVQLTGGRYGMAAAVGNNVVITRSTISGNTTAGVHADSGARINVSNTTLSNNTVNVSALGPIHLRENDIHFSNTAITGNGAVSAGGNRFIGNGSIGSTPSSISGAPPDVFN